MKCDVCGKDMADYAGVVGFRLRLGWDESESRRGARIRKQFGPYETRDYDICIECVLRTFGVPEPKE